MIPIVVFCWRDGAIGYSNTLPPEALHIGTFRELLISLQIAVNDYARIDSRDGMSLLVPGVPEAASDEEVTTAVAAFARHLRDRLQRGRSA